MELILIILVSLVLGAISVYSVYEATRIVCAVMNIISNLNKVADALYKCAGREEEESVRQEEVKDRCGLDKEQRAPGG